MQTILVTGGKGMIGSQLVSGLLDAGYRVVSVDRVGEEETQERFVHVKADLADREALNGIMAAQRVDRVIHLAALAHTAGEKDLSWERYRHVNVTCAENVFEAAGDRPLLFISTVDVYGFTKGLVDEHTELRPVSEYGRSKKMAEESCRRICSRYTVFRFSPVYTDTVKRDIQKRYYLKYPKLAYQIGKNTEYEILNIRRAVQAMVAWCAQEPQGETRIIKDDVRMNTADYIRAEKAAGRANVVLHLPAWMVHCGYAVLKALTGENNYTYLLNKAVYPLRSR